MAAAPEDRPPDPPAGSAATQAAVLETAGVREAAVLETAGRRDAATLATAGDREAEILKAAGSREAAALTAAGQRGVNLLWEHTQMRIALAIVVAVTLAQLCVTGAVIFKILLRDTLDPVLLALLGGVLGSLAGNMSLVIGFYFGRTNHQRVGGVGPHDAGR